MDREPTYQTVERAAARLGIPAAWLRAEAEAGRLPCVKAGRRTLLSAAAVEVALLSRANTGDTEQGENRGN